MRLLTRFATAGGEFRNLALNRATMQSSAIDVERTSQTFNL